MTYQAPVDDILSALKSAADLPGLIRDGVAGDLDEETIRAVLDEAGRFGTEVLDPLNRLGDETGSRLDGGTVVTPPGWKEAYEQFTAAGWSALGCPPEYGGQGLPTVVAMAVCEIWNSANMSFGVCPMLTNGAIDSLHIGGSEAIKAQYLPPMISGRWTGTMNLTEPQAGSDLNAVTCKAVPQADGTYRLFGTKIFISYGEHELAENIIHLVLARVPDAPAGTRGISLFLVPKRLVGRDGAVGAQNDVVCAGVEHKLGIRASPTCVMKFGERDGAVGYLVGEVNRGLNTMFHMMNAARLAVGVQGVAVAERALQRAKRYAAERRQGRATSSTAGAMAPIVEHPDVRRMLLTMMALTGAARAICLATAAYTDRSQRAASADERQSAALRVALLTPIAKAFSTDTAVDVASLGVQVHGGMGFVEETGAAQHLRDARILPIYEGTNGIQAIDLVTRKLPLEGGAVAQAFMREMAATVEEALRSNQPRLGRAAERLAETLAALETASLWMAGTLAKHPDAALAGATPYLRLFSLAAGGHYLTKAALDAVRDGTADAGRPGLMSFYAENIAVAGPALARTVMDGGQSILSIPAEALSA